jgi:hypothetical protein
VWLFIAYFPSFLSHKKYPDNIKNTLTAQIAKASISKTISLEIPFAKTNAPTPRIIKM